MRKDNNSLSKMTRFIIFADRFLTVITAVAYIIVVISYFMNKDYVKLIETIALPAGSFVIVSVFRYFYNAPRPYDITGNVPLSGRKKNGKSMPSRHTFSIFVIAMTLLMYYWPIGVAFFVAGACLGFLRVLEGEHFVKDVVVGGVLGILFGLIYLILP